MGDIKFDIVEEIGVLSTSSKGWNKEINKVSWNGATPKYDIRDWSPDHEKMGKGVTLTEGELKQLLSLFAKEPESQKTSGGTELKHESSKQEPIKNPENKPSVDDLYKKWNDACKHSPAPIREALKFSEIDKITDDKVIVILKKGSYDHIASSSNKKMLDAFIAQLLGRHVDVELVESSRM